MQQRDDEKDLRFPNSHTPSASLMGARTVELLGRALPKMQISRLYP